MIGTNVLDSKYDEIIAKPTASVSGMNKRPERVAHHERRDEHREDAEQRQEAGDRRDQAPVRTAEAMLSVRPSGRGCSRPSRSTRRRGCRSPAAIPPSDMMLIVLPVIQSPNSEPRRASGMLATTTITLRMSRRNRRIIRPVSTAPMSPSVATLSDGGQHRGRLVELEVDLDVLGHRVAETAASTCGYRPRRSGSSRCPS